jgi:exonuclease VII large subunit
MMEALENNAAAANDEYKNQYLSVTGQLSNIDAQGSYIDIIDPDDEFAITGCQCYINGNEEIASIVKTLSKGDIITVKGKITDVGEVLGYSMTIDSIETE